MLRVAEKAYLPGLRQPRHAHAETTVTIVIGGSLRERVGRVDEIARPLSVVVKPGGTEHANEFGPKGTRTVQIALPCADASAAVDWERTLRVWRWTHAGPAVRSFLALLRVLRSADGAPESDRTDEIECAAHDVLAALRGQTAATRSSAPPRWLEILREELDDVGSARPRVRALAASAGVHPVYLARQFRRFYGCSVSEYLQRQRLQRTADMVASSGGALSLVSYTAGFADQAHMCRVFRAHTGVTPGAFRALANGERLS
ncbi:MAG: AraC family transcriptional regulator [Gemmatimonadota bacterium]|nr:AraC family transcriptional regulator [Gemmatimonadota bacterium]